jgi:hypothetical protein
MIEGSTCVYMRETCVSRLIVVGAECIYQSSVLYLVPSLQNT